MPDINVTGTTRETGLDAAEKLKEITIFTVAPMVNQIIDHTQTAPVGIALRAPGGLVVGGTATLAGSAGVTLGGTATVEVGGAAGKPLAVQGVKEGHPIRMDWTLGGGKEPLQVGPLTLRLQRTAVSPHLTVQLKLFGVIPLFTLSLHGTIAIGEQ